MTKKTNQVSAAWGLELGGSEVRLARVSLAADGYQVDAYLTVPLADRWDREPALGECLARLGAPELDGPLAMCVGDSFALTRMLELPAVREQLAAMVQRQMEAMLPSPDRFLMGWAHRAHPLQKGQELVTLCAVRRDVFARQSQAASRLGAQAAGVLPSAMALAGGAARTGGEPGLAALLDVGAACTTLSWTLDGSPLGTAVIDEGGDRWTRLLAEELKLDLRQAESLKVAVLSAPEASGAPDGVPEGLWAQARRVVSQAAADWAQQVGEIDYALRPCMPQDERPARCSLYGQGASSPLLAALVGRALRLPALAAQRPARLALSEGVSYPAAATAIGAALCLLEPQPTVCMLSGGGAAESRPGNGSTPRRKWAIAGAWVLGAVLALYGLDVYEAHRAQQAVDRVHAALGPEQDMPQQAAVVRYLSGAGAPPLVILSEVSLLAPPQAVLTSWRYNRSGEMALSGSVSGEQDVHEFMKKLSQSSQFREVSLLSAKSEAGKCQFELALKLTAGARAAASQPATAASSGPASAPGVASSRPADAPPARGPENLSAPPGAGPPGGGPPPGAMPAPEGAGVPPLGGAPPVAAPSMGGEGGGEGGSGAPGPRVGRSRPAPVQMEGAP